VPLTAVFLAKVVVVATGQLVSVPGWAKPAPLPTVILLPARPLAAGKVVVTAHPTLPPPEEFVHADTASTLPLALPVKVGAAPLQLTFVLLPTTGVVGTAGIDGVAEMVTVSIVVLSLPTRNRISFGTLTVTLTRALAVTVLPVAVSYPYWDSAIEIPDANASAAPTVAVRMLSERSFMIVLAGEWSEGAADAAQFFSVLLARIMPCVTVVMYT